MAQTQILPSYFLPPSLCLNASSPVPSSTTKVSIVAYGNAFYHTISSLIPFSLIVVFRNGTILNLAVVEFMYFVGVSISASISPSKITLLLSTVVTTFSTFLRVLRFIVVCDMVWDESSNSAPSVPILFNRSSVARVQFVYVGCDLRTPSYLFMITQREYGRFNPYFVRLQPVKEPYFSLRFLKRLRCANLGKAYDLFAIILKLHV